jgi:DNA-binding IclR family transcriptional regulator
MVAIAVPVYDTDKRFVASLAFHGPVPRLDIDKAVANLDVLLDAAEKLKHALFS